MNPHQRTRRRAALFASISLLAMAPGVVWAQSAPSATTDIGSVDVQSAGKAALPIATRAAVGSNAPAGSAPALAPSQAPLDSFEPVSIVSDKIIQDVIPNSSDYNEAAKFTPGFVSANTNGLIGDTKGGWRGYQDGQYNITFDGIPFGDANDPTHHSAAYFPGAILGGVTIDRGPGPASQIGYATYGGTMALRSYDLSDTFGGSVQSGYGSYATQTSSFTIQTGQVGNSGVRGLLQVYNSYTGGAIDFGKYNQNQFVGKVEKQFDSFKVTAFANVGTEHYNNVTSITYPQLQLYGKSYGAINGNPATQQFVGWNNSQKQTDMEYIDVDGNIGGWHFDNKVYTYSYWYPNLQNNGANQTIEGAASIANGGTITSVSIPTITGGKTKVSILGVANGDVTGYIKFNNYRAWGDIFKVEKDVDAGFASGTFRTGVWSERVDNERMQQYIDYTTGKLYTALGNSAQASFKLNLVSHIDNVQPFVEYNWRPIDGLTITPGYKFESFTREHDATINQTTLQPLYYNATYTSNLPFLAATYQVNKEISVYAQASKGTLAPTVSAFYVFNPGLGGIQPQETTNYQIGAVYKSNRITADADIYQVTATNFPVVNNLPTGQQIYTNGGTARYRGAEAEGSYSIMNGFSAYASGALIEAKYIAGQFSGLRVGDAPSYTAVAGAIYDDGFLFGSLLQKFTGDFYGSSGQKAASATTNANLNKVSGYDTADFVIGFRTSYLHDLGIGKSAEVKLGIYNILDHKSTTEIGGDPTGLTSVNNTSLTYSFLPGRMIFGSVKVGF